MTYAAETSVSVDRSRNELERTLQRYGADAFGYASRAGEAVVEFTTHARHVRFTVLLPDRGEKRFVLTSQGRKRSPAASMEAWEQACRQRWRALNLVVKAKLEAVEAGISTIEEEFLAHTVLPNGRTVWEETRDVIAKAYELGTFDGAGLLRIGSGK